MKSNNVRGNTMNDPFPRRAWAFLIVLTSCVAAAAVWTLPEDPETKDSHFRDVWSKVAT
jgi:hypothetical protein